MSRAPASDPKTSEQDAPASESTRNPYLASIPPPPGAPLEGLDLGRPLYSSSDVADACVRRISALLKGLNLRE